MLTQPTGQAIEPQAIEVVGEAASGPEALALVERLRPDLLVLDLALPGLPGIEVCRQVRVLGVRVVILSMYASAGEHVRRARAARSRRLRDQGQRGNSELAAAIIRRVIAGGEGPFPRTDDDPARKASPSASARCCWRSPRARATARSPAALDISVHTVNTHRVHLMEKLGVHDVTALTRLAHEHGLLG